MFLVELCRLGELLSAAAPTWPSWISRAARFGGAFFEQRLPTFVASLQAMTPKPFQVLIAWILVIDLRESSRVELRLPGEPLLAASAQPHSWCLRAY